MHNVEYNIANIYLLIVLNQLQVEVLINLNLNLVYNKLFFNTHVLLLTRKQINKHLKTLVLFS